MGLYLYFRTKEQNKKVFFFASETENFYHYSHVGSSSKVLVLGRPNLEAELLELIEFPSGKSRIRKGG
jgi:hypothetical protein